MTHLKMKKILFFSTPAYGHLTAVHPVITHQVKDGHEVVWYCSSKYKDIVSMSGARYEEYVVLLFGTAAGLTSNMQLLRL